MTKKLKITRIIAIIAFGMYLITMVLPYESILLYNDLGERVDSLKYGYKSGYIYLFIFFFPALLFTLLKHNLAMKILSFIMGIWFLILPVWIRVDNFAWYTKPKLGFYLFVFAGLLMFVASIIKLTIKVPIKKYKQHELLDDF